MANSEFATRGIICTCHACCSNLDFLLLVMQYSFGMQLRTMLAQTEVGKAINYVRAYSGQTNKKP